jgi:enoyl-CoA hydratase/carnithine racemase
MPFRAVRLPVRVSSYTRSKPAGVPGTAGYLARCAIGLAQPGDAAGPARIAGGTMTYASGRMIANTEGAIGWMIFNQPEKRNAISVDMWEAMPQILGAFAADPAVRVIVLTGAGEQAFISGADISQFGEKRGTRETVLEYNATADRAAEALSRVGKPTIAMIRGFCIGGGVGVATSCDLRIAADDAKFGVPAAKLGLGYRYVGVKRLVDLVGPSFAKEIFFTGRQFTTAEALAMGLVNRGVPVGELEATVREMAKAIADNAPLTISSIKLSVGEAMKPESERDLDSVQAAVDACFESQDYVEGRTAFMEKRKPVFRGR